MGVISNIKKRRSEGKKKDSKDPNEEMSFLDHLEELRWHLARSIGAVVFFAIFFFINREFILDEIILKPFQPDFPTNKFLCSIRDSLCGQINVEFIAITPYETFLKALGLSLIGGLLIAFPYILWEIWSFIKPGLHSHEKSGLRGNIFVMSLLFFLGVGFSYYVITPFSIQFLAGFEFSQELSNQWRIGSVISLVAQIALGGGVIFEMPILVFYLTKLGVVTPDFLKQYRRHSYVILLILAAIITPPDVLSQILIFIPLSALYELSIRISKMVIRKEKKREEKEKKDESTEQAVTKTE